jgi:hypothetical protein
MLGPQLPEQEEVKARMGVILQVSQEGQAVVHEVANEF